MKITKTQLRKIIKEEVQNMMSESDELESKSNKELQHAAMMLDIDDRSKLNREELIQAIIEREALFARAREGRDERGGSYK
jgi:CRISPR/Cas system-associated protein Cas10 (large subunit of type III CRISPR-Cas system)